MAVGEHLMIRSDEWGKNRIDHPGRRSSRYFAITVAGGGGRASVEIGRAEWTPNPAAGQG